MKRFRWGFGARWRAVLLALTVPLVAAGAIFIWQDYQARREAVVTQVRLKSAEVNAQLEDFVHTTRGASHVYAATWMTFNSELVTDLEPGATSAAPNRYLAEFLSDKPRFSNAIITDLDGTLLASSAGFEAGERLVAGDFVTRARTNDDFTVSDVYLPSEASPSALFSQPLRDATGETVGLLVLESSLDTISSSLDMSVGFPTSAKSGIFDSSGRVLAGTGYQDPHPGMVAGIDVSSAPVWAQAMNRPTAEWFGPGLDKVDRIIFFGYPDQTPWITTVAYEQAEIFDPLWQRIWGFGGALLATIAATLWVGEIFIRRERRGAASQEKERRTLDAVMNGATDGIVVVDSDGRVNFVNPQFRWLFDLPSAPVDGRPFSEVLACTENRGLIDADARERLEEATSGEDRIVLEPLRLECTPPLEIGITSYPLRNGQGEGLGRTVVLHDVTKAKAVQRMKSQFLATASHQLRTPMTSILAFSELLTSRKVPVSRKDRWIGQIHQQADRMITTINTMLNVSQIEAGRLDLKVEDFDAAEVFDSVIRDLSVNTGHRIEMRVNARMSRIRADKHRFRQVVENLIDNAMKYTPETGVIKITAESYLDGLVDFAVRDNGVGVPIEEQQHLFTPFYRVPGASTDKVSGTGLGLYISRSIAELHGGDVWVESTPGLGSCFHFTFPSAAPPIERLTDTANAQQADKRHPVGSF